MAKRAFWLDDPVVIVRDGNLNRALRILRTRLENLRLFPTLRERRENPTTSDRRRAKSKRAALRKKRKEMYRK
jgi:ribosomal protein S21